MFFHFVSISKLPMNTIKKLVNQYNVLMMRVEQPKYDSKPKQVGVITV